MVDFSTIIGKQTKLSSCVTIMVIISVTESVILYSMTTKQTPVEFVEKIKAKMSAENISVRELARILGVSHPTVTELVTYGHRPSFDTCVALAKWLKQTDVSTLREAGLLPSDPKDDIKFDDWKELLKHLSSEDQAEMRIIAEGIIKKRKIDARQKSLKPKKEQ